MTGSVVGAVVGAVVLGTVSVGLIVGEEVPMVVTVAGGAALAQPDKSIDPTRIAVKSSFFTVFPSWYLELILL